jgi:hypothetical protein
MNSALVSKTAFLAAAFASVGLGACAHQPALKPAPGAPVQPGDQSVALIEVAGVGISVAANAWEGDPKNLPELVVSLQVTIANNSGKPLRVSYRDFTLAGSSGATYPAIPPVKPRGQVGASSLSSRFELASFRPARVQQLLLAAYAGRRFYVAPHLSSFYPGFEPWPSTFPYDPLWYEQVYALWPKSLPTQEMVSKALPEGALKDGGDVVGFLYFQKPKKESHVQFEMALVDASDGQSFGEVRIPFVLSK